MIVAEKFNNDDIEKMLDEVDRLYFDENLKLEDAIREVKEKMDNEQYREVERKVI